ncbi:NAD(P)-binding protein [Macroventuria anomochaeta]|uniref:NAD(P)-binding protein n=1 Tax=Macroventuria anomochaeta TaxID=301207 RepID=A0ACB6S8Q9_9PLEO|nr:NAD(P)-binding protein [Macroventuria anomochaeta]KAF2629527.1 NAD(P)-binding protein [Macroventuria anomochaeta]
MTIALTSATGKLGGAVLNAILENKLIDPRELVVCTSSDPSDSHFDGLRSQSITLRHANFDDPSSLTRAYAGCSKLFLVSTPRTEMDYNDAPLWQGREKHHRAAIDAALEAGVQHIYYTSLGFANPSKAGVMRAHIRTEAYLHDLEKEGKVRITIIREGLYNESWPLYFGYYFGLKDETRREVVVAGDGPVSWTSIPDMAFGTAKVLAAPSEAWSGKTFYLSQKKTWTLHDIARIVSKVRGEEIGLKVVGRKEYEEFYAQKGTERASVEWWSSSYDALEDGECAIDDSTVEDLLKEAGKRPKPLEETIEEMLK